MDDTRALKSSLDWLAREAEIVYDRVRELPVTPTVTVDELRREVASRIDLEHGMALPELTGAVSDILKRYSLHVTHPRYFGLFNPSVHPSTVLADALVALYNPQVGGWSHAPAANEMERLVLRWLARALGQQPDATAAHFTSGGNEANHTAVVTALAHKFPAWATRGLRALERQPVIYVSSESHHSFIKIARATGLGVEALRHVEVDDRLRMRLDRLETLVASDLAAGFDPLMVVATAGTTGAGAIDPLSAIAEFCARERIWMHVDAAWGGAAALAPRLRPALAGIEHADSITFDAHKWLSVPLGAGIFFTRHESSLSRAFGVDTAYVPPTQVGAVDLYKVSMQWSRRFIGLKVLFALAEHGEAGIARLIDHQAVMADRLRDRLNAHGWRIVNDTPLPLVCFTHDKLDNAEAATKALVGRVLARGRAWISDVRVPHAGWVLRACVTSYRTDERDLDILVEELHAAL